VERSPEIEQFVHGMYAAMRAGEGKAAAGMVADGDGVLFVGTDADEWWDSTSVARAAFQAQMEATGGFDMVNMDPRGYREGDVGWFSDQPGMRFPDGTVMPMRLTGVVRLSDGAWRMVQGHLSLPAAVNEELFE
jgi:SnoaL-like domain